MKQINMDYINLGHMFRHQGVIIGHYKYIHRKVQVQLIYQYPGRNI
jgi:hypothetical protein